MNDLLTWQVAGAKITKIPEQQSTAIPATSLFPQWNRQTVSAFAEHLKPNCIDLQTETLTLSTHSWLVERDGKFIIIDTASGNGKDRPGNPKFHQMKSDWLKALRSTGVTPEQVDAVVLTHLHVDHVGWNTTYCEGEWIPTFPNARYYFSAQEYIFYQDPENVMRPSIGALEDSVIPVVASGQAVLLDEHAAEIFPGLRIHRTPGHSVAHLAFSMSRGGETALFWGDIAHSPLQVCLPQWNSSYCEFPDTAQQSRRDMLSFAAETGALVFTSHFPDRSVGKCVSINGQLCWQHA
ncbi:beta-lactamase domain protein [Serratia sp. AS12]|uniref:MBL fold metallo-hydrolase n=1 Tax=Serratia TaxID=613 RepID=UPI00020E9B35|nr:MULTISPECIES: MBL fold metallo-hydrolase [Serratia]AEF47351.1 beta-lactamase domain protein [Serratia plymuthica AS9]AEF52303.1 beta-lactamase domain protein [Serratia sp. AS12]AEG30010.1 beta-lactamase domain protein [Serratia sp. AS13]UTN96023.1 MBL fold metallo-hydrolase [Serratia plymuthica]